MATVFFALLSSSVAYEMLPFPIRWVHAPKTGSLFGAAVADLICDGYGDGSQGEFRQFRGTKVRCTTERYHGGACEMHCSGNEYYGRSVTVDLGPRNGVNSFAHGHYPLTDGTTTDLILFLRDPFTRLASQYRQGMLHWCEGDTRDECFDGDAIKKLKSQSKKDCDRFTSWVQIPGVKSCTTKLLLGSPCHGTTLPSIHQATALADLIRGRHGAFKNYSAVFVGDTSRWDLSICLFYAKFSDNCPPHETLSDSTGIYDRHKYDGPPFTCMNTSLAAGDTDAILYQAAVDRVDADWLQVGFRVRHCPPCRPFFPSDDVGDHYGGGPRRRRR